MGIETVETNQKKKWRNQNNQARDLRNPQQKDTKRI
jgi:hypothetical protein